MITRLITWQYWTTLFSLLSTEPFVTSVTTSAVGSKVKHRYPPIPLLVRSLLYLLRHRWRLCTAEAAALLVWAISLSKPQKYSITFCRSDEMINSPASASVIKPAEALKHISNSAFSPIMTSRDQTSHISIDNCFFFFNSLTLTELKWSYHKRINARFLGSFLLNVTISQDEKMFEKIRCSQSESTVRL